MINKRNIKMLLTVTLCLCFLAGCNNSSYVGKWTTTTIRKENKADKDFQKETGYKQIITLNADGTYDLERIVVDKKKYSEEDCKEFMAKFEKDNPNPKWKIITNKKTGKEGIVFWHDKADEPNENDKLDFILQDGYLQMKNGSFYECYER